MEGSMDRDCSALGGLFQTIVNDMRASSLVWEDFTSKAAKLHTQLKATVGAIGGFLEVFQKVADMATGSRGATKEIGSALTRLCMRHKSIEAKLKALTGSILDNLVIPVQEHSEDWKKTVIQLDKDHAKEYKKARQDIKKAASDTMRLQKKVKKGKSEQNKLDNAMIDVNNKYMALEDTEKNAIRKILIEERGRYCLFVSCLRPFVEHELGLLTEITHLQEIMDHLCMQCNDPHTLPPASEQVIMDLKGFDSNSVWSFSQPSPPSSPSSIGSRKSSMCSISSINSSSSGSIKSHSPSHLNHKRISTQQLPMGTARLTSVSSQDSGFTSQDTLFQRPATPTSLNIRHKDADNISTGTDNADADSQSSTPSDNTPSASSTWTTWPNPPSQGNKVDESRPHTISSAYEKNHARPALNPKLFEPPPQESPAEEEEDIQMRNGKKKHERSHSGSTPYNRPQSATINKMQPVLPPLAPKPRSKAVPPPKVPVLAAVGEQPTYVNMNDLANMAKEQQKESLDNDHTPTEKDPPTIMSHPQMQKNSMELAQAIKELEASTAELQSTYDSSTSQHSLQCSSGYGTMNSTPANSQDTIATGGIPVSHGAGASITRRCSMNTPKPPPPVRRSSSISTANPVTLQKYRKTPPRQLQPGPSQPSVLQQQQQQQQQQYRASHRRSNSSGSESEPAYAELQTIQQSIQARQNLQQHQEATPYATTATQNIAYSAPPTPSQYAQPNAMPPLSGHHSHQQQPAGQVELMQKLNAQFSALNAAYKDEELPPPPPDLQNIDPDLPPPPTLAELEEIEKVYSRPQGVNPKPTQQQQGQLRASLVSELKLGLRKMSTDEGSEC